MQCFSPQQPDISPVLTSAPPTPKPKSIKKDVAEREESAITKTERDENKNPEASTRTLPAEKKVPVFSSEKQEKATHAPLKSERNYGIDLLKTLAMLMVVILHILGQGGVIGATAYPEPTHWMAWFLEIESYGAVNCFAIATGFLMAGRKVKYRRLVSLWVTVEFYNIAFYLLYRYFPIPGVSLLDVSNFYPVYSGQFWYFTAYFGMFLFIPFFNALIEKLSKKQLYFMLLTAFILFPVGSNLYGYEPFGLTGGYSMWWLTLMYFVGAAIAKHGFLRKTPTYLALIGYIGCTLVTFAGRMLVSYVIANPVGDWTEWIILYGQLLVNYNAPFVLFGAIFLVIFCLNLEIPRKLGKAIAKIQPFVFQVYIIHLHYYVWKGIITGSFAHFAKKKWYMLPLWVEGTAVLIFAACILIDVCRHWLFKLLHIEKIIDAVSFGICRWYEKSKLKKKIDALLA